MYTAHPISDVGRHSTALYCIAFPIVKPRGLNRRSDAVRRSHRNTGFCSEANKASGA